MIKQEVVDKIMDAARIEEVVGEFVDLKKRGSSLIGLCPFHNEKTPSFNVSVSKGIYKCFGCGAGGDSVRFIMDHEKYSYPEALRFLAQKYHIEIEETEQTDEQAQLRDHRESLLIVTGWASEFFIEQLWETEEGQTIGLNYFKERGFREDIIRKFGLGYAPEAWTALADQAKAKGYQEDYLIETGLIVKKEEGRSYDRFRGRVIFPIHNLTGRVLGFGGRTLKTDKQTPKYVNSPESEIYHKSNVLYGLNFAKKAISQADKCLMVEGYADVIALHQAGIENVVSSSGTSLTSGQIRLISRYTQQVTLLFDGDAAGIKAALRGTDMLLEEGLNVKILLVPDGDDPDSYIRKHGSEAFKAYLEKHEEDFISFKTKVLLRDAGHDPIRRAETIREVVESIALIPDQIKASVFIRECSSLLDIEERILLHELNKIRIDNSRRKSRQENSAGGMLPGGAALGRENVGGAASGNKDNGNSEGVNAGSSGHQQTGGQTSSPANRPDQPLVPDSAAARQHGAALYSTAQHGTAGADSTAGTAATNPVPTEAAHQSPVALQEREFIRVLLNYGREPAGWENTPDLPIAPLLINSVQDIPFEDQACAAIVAIYQSYLDNQRLPEDRIFISNKNKQIADLSIALLSPKYEISPNWNDDKRKIYVPEEKENLEELVYTCVYRIKKRWVETQMHRVREEIKSEKDEANTQILLQKYQSMKDALKIIGERLGTIILK